MNMEPIWMLNMQSLHVYLIWTIPENWEYSSPDKLNPLLHMLFLDHDIISIFRQHWKKLKKIKKNFK